MENPAIDLLLEDLKSPDVIVREQATQKLWGIWFQQKGAYGLDILKHSQALLETGRIEEAEAVLTDLIQDQPDFAEAWNRRAVLYYLQGEYQKSLADCQQVVILNPVHFGALHGMGVCYAALEEYRKAIHAFQQASEIQPHAVTNQRLILECTARLS
ncbi:MAG: tetratricopeptide repeat protein [Leptolyngbyaceae cyanobacterium CRU_2_3]|nr:tetratricopeptide repeat protein [Leptolyngbyaceae cyanobacterium CRU_2_3]